MHAMALHLMAGSNQQQFEIQNVSWSSQKKNTVHSSNTPGEHSSKCGTKWKTMQVVLRLTTMEDKYFEAQLSV
jgi:hypothetical protein